MSWPNHAPQDETSEWRYPENLFGPVSIDSESRKILAQMALTAHILSKRLIQLSKKRAKIASTRYAKSLSWTSCGLPARVMELSRAASY